MNVICELLNNCASVIQESSMGPGQGSENQLLAVLGNLGQDLSS